MAKIKLTKNELKTQRDSLKRFERYLPTLQLKKQQLQLEIRQVREAVDLVERDRASYQHKIHAWVRLFDDPTDADLRELVEVEEWHTGIRNIAGIDTPVFEFVRFREVTYDLFTTPPYYDDALNAVRKMIEYELRARTMREQLALIEQELRVVTQRVNLFEKVKIPESKGNIRRIQIYLGDQQTNAVGRSKIAKGKCAIRDAAMAASA
ncbi:MAG: V-type ATP synthase subunit D [Victivallales bacterium]|jgi:V/A-type H+/Na+-transporting ATPase subunit D|nr:V-type ATP synthase subunit D [Victivallales bacterium]MBT7165257.1 V-type ATP synthase subunit D [Victivallales bacterium]